MGYSIFIIFWKKSIFWTFTYKSFIFINKTSLLFRPFFFDGLLIVHFGDFTDISFISYFVGEGVNKILFFDGCTMKIKIIHEIYLKLTF